MSFQIKNWTQSLGHFSVKSANTISGIQVSHFNPSLKVACMSGGL
jgi:hypothetical protein